MKELIEAAFSSVNIFPTILFGLIILYWLFVFIGALDMDFLNFDVEGDVDMDVDVDADIDVEVDADLEIDADADVDVDADADVGADVDADADTDIGEVEGGVLISLNSVLSFFNLGKVPFMILMSFFTLSMWVISISVNHILGNQSTLFSLVLLIPNIILSLIISKVLTTPFAMIYTRMAKNNDDNFKYQGNMCKMIMPATDTKIGQAEINDRGNTFRVNVLTKEGTKIEKGESGLIINYIASKKCYLVEPYKI